MPFSDVVLHQYDNPVDAVCGVVVILIALDLFLVSRFKAATQPSGHPIIVGLLWAAALIYGVAAVRLLYFCIRLYK